MRRSSGGGWRCRQDEAKPAVGKVRAGPTAVRRRIVGINEISVAGLGGAIPVELAQRIARELIERGAVERAWLGVEWQPVTAADVADLVRQALAAQ